MALIFNDVAICGLGMSCQTAMQLDTHKGYLEQLIGQSAVRRTTPFHWLISSPLSIAQMVQEDCFFPERIGAFSKTPQPRWDEMQVLYYHEKNIGDSFSELRSKWRHIAENFSLIKTILRKIFILSNTQNNLLPAGSALNAGWSVVSNDTMATVRSALEARFGDVELHCVVYADRHELTAEAPIDGMHVLEKDQSAVSGDALQWKQVLSGIIATRVGKKAP